MRRSLLFICLFLLSVFVFADIASAVSVSLNSSSCSIVDSQSIVVHNMYASGIGSIEVYFQWDPYNNIFLPFAAYYESGSGGGGGGGGGSQSHAPSVYNLSVPSSVGINQSFCISYSYSDPAGLSDVKEHHILMSDGTHAVYSAQGSGTFYNCSFYFSSSGTQWVQVYVVDSRGSTSNSLSAYISVEMFSGGGCYNDPVYGYICVNSVHQVRQNKQY